MRKFYHLLAVAVLSFSFAGKATANPVTPDVANFSFLVDPPTNNVKFWSTSVFGSEPGPRFLQWVFGDNTQQYSGIHDSVNHHYPTAAIYNACLRIYRIRPTLNDTVLTAYICKPVEIPVYCSASFDIINSTGSPFLKYFIAHPFHNQNKKPVEICWHFGDSHDTCIQYSNTYGGPYVVSHRYADTGRFYVCVNIHYDGGCQSTSCSWIHIEVPDSCGADFERLLTPSINPLLAYFRALPSNNHNRKPARICWQFGDGHDTCLNYTESYTGQYAVAHLYAVAGTYNVCVNILYFGGCEAHKCKNINIIRPDSCAADFERLPNTTPNPLTANYKALPYHNNGKKPLRVCWYFGDGHDTCLYYTVTYTGMYTVTHTYAAPATYQVCVSILYDGGCLAYKCKPIIISRPDSCAADFERLPNTTPNPLTANYKALPYHNNGKKPVRVCWHFGDGHDTCLYYTVTYTGMYTVTHTYAAPATYQVCVSILYDGGCLAYKCKPIIISRPDSCAADFERLPNTTPNPLIANYKALPYHSNNKKPVRVCWQFGDGHDTCLYYTVTYTGMYNVIHTYRFPGLYQVCVSILYDGGCLAYKCKSLQIGRPDTCGADFERLPSPTANPLLVYLRALPQHNNNRKPSRICWQFGDGHDTCINYPENDTLPYVVSHRYAQPGTYNVCIHILYFGGCEAGKCKYIQVYPPPTCSVTLFELTQSATSLTRGFVAIPTTVPYSRPQRVCWHFGDGHDTCIIIPATPPVVTLTITHTYPGPGVYHACVDILFVNGCQAADCREVVIRGEHNICGGYETDSLTGPRTFLFRGFSIHGPNDSAIAYHWSFGDGSSAAGRIVTHTYATPGEYRVCLLINTLLGCETRICKTLRVPGPHQANLVLWPNPVLTELHADFFSLFTEQVNVRIVNAAGNIVRSTVKNATVGLNTWVFDVSTLFPGVYSFQVQSSNQFASAIFLKL